MKARSLIGIFISCICKYTSVDIMPELKRNILNFGHRIYFKYVQMLSHSFDIFYVVTKFILPTIKDLKFLPIKFDSTCNYLNVDLSRNKFPMQYIPNIENFCKKIVPFIDFYKKQINYHNQTAHEILTKKVSWIQPNFPKDRKEKVSINPSLITGFIRFAYDGISIYLHNKRKKAFVAMENLE